MDSFKLVLIATVTGLIVGAVFSFFKLPIPAPATFSGISAIFGIYAGYKLVSYFIDKF